VRPSRSRIGDAPLRGLLHFPKGHRWNNCALPERSTQPRLTWTISPSPQRCRAVSSHHPQPSDGCAAKNADRVAATYLDSSAIVKLAVRETESDALRNHLRRRRPLVTSALARTEVLRALLPGGETALVAGRRVLERIDLVRVNDRVLNLAGSLLPEELRSLDAIHLATAGRLGTDLGEIVTYDEKMTAAARIMGYKISAPT
jgi:predicted nucleic acid-binding protein